jgi:hypothetical protein
MPPAADRPRVGSQRSIRLAVDTVVRALPPSYLVGVHQDARLVIGPTGAFVLLPGTSPSRALARDADRLHRLTEATRDALCDHLSWVPFLDALVVTAGDLVRSPEITVAPLDLLSVVLTEGPEVIDAATRLAVRQVLADGKLVGWSRLVADQSRPDARIDLCDPADITTAQR